MIQFMRLLTRHLPRRLKQRPGAALKVLIALVAVGFVQMAGCVDSPRVHRPELPSLLEGATAAPSVDLDSIVARDTLRVITRYSPSTYFLYRGRELGFEYELASAYAQRLGVHLQMVVARSQADVIPMLLDGRGDVAAPGYAALPPNAGDARSCSAYGESHLVLVTRTDDDSLRTLVDLSGRTVHVREGSRAHHELRTLSESLVDSIAIVTVSTAWDNESLIAEVEAGRISLAVADWPTVGMELAYHPGVRVGPMLGSPDSTSWLVRPDAERLAESINTFFAETNRSAFFNILKDKYFEQPARYSRYKSEYARFRQSGELSQYDTLIRRYAEEHGLDWRLVAAQVYQESRFNPRAQSWAGARGLMQLMPVTARSLGVHNTYSVHQNLSGGMRYLAQQVARFDTLGPNEALAFGLAAYNAGFGHVQDARELARREGLNPNVWSGNVETAIEMLAYERYYREATYGYCRGSETTDYVSRILKRWQVYRDMLDYQQDLPIL